MLEKKFIFETCTEENIWTSQRENKIGQSKLHIDIRNFLFGLNVFFDGKILAQKTGGASEKRELCSVIALCDGTKRFRRSVCINGY